MSVMGHFNETILDLDAKDEMAEIIEVGKVEYDKENTHTLDLARRYVQHCRDHPTYSPEVIREAVTMGDETLRAAVCLEDAMAAVRSARREIIGCPTEGAITDEVLSQLPPEHAEYLKAMHQDGVPTRRYYPPTRLRAEPYPSAVDRLDEMFQKAWKDGHWGIVLFASDDTESYTKNLIECPQGRVPKQLPDRSISAQGSHPRYDDCQCCHP